MPVISLLGTIFNPSSPDLLAHTRITFREYILNNLSLILMISRLGTANFRVAQISSLHLYIRVREYYSTICHG